MMRPIGLCLLAGGLLCFTPQSSVQASELPDASGKDLVEAFCTGCHQTNQITRSSGYDRDGWHELAATMIDLGGSPEQRDRLLDYLAANVPPNENRAARLVDGEATIAFEEWQVPTLGQRSRDPVEAPDGAIWWAGQWANLIGRIDPANGEMEEFPLPAGAMPHSVNIDDDGGVWYMGNKNGTVGKLDPDSGEITVFGMPDPAARDPHTAVFDADGILWFTLQQSNMVGRLDPATGEVRLARMPTAGARPYGIEIDAEGSPWIACNGSNCLAKLDPATLAITEIELPDPATRVRRLDFDADGKVWFVNSSLGRLGRFDPATGDIEEWPSPSGPGAHPYAIAVIDGIVWYNESGVRPDALVRFDPATVSFQSWPIPSGNVHAGIVRHMRPTRNGDLLIHQSSTNRIILVTLDGASPVR